MLNDLQKRTAEAIVNVFETGRVRGDYGRVTVLPGDSGHLTYGRSQTTLASGNLHLLVAAYVEAPGALAAGALAPYLPRLAARDVRLDRDPTLRRFLEEAGRDPLMWEVQDRFFDRVYWSPSAAAASALGAQAPLGLAVVYDSHVHGSWGRVRRLTEERHGSLADVGERAWIPLYVRERRTWLATHPNAVLHATVYRMDAFQSLIDEDAWDLPLPLRVRGATIDEETLGAPTPVRASAHEDAETTLFRRTPPFRGPAVEALQRALRGVGIRLKVDGVFGAQTEKAVRRFQGRRGLKVDGVVGPATRSALGL